MYSTNATSVHLRGPEDYPNDKIISYWGNLAKNGAAIVTCRLAREKVKYDTSDIGVKSYLRQLTEAIHFHGSKAAVVLTQNSEPGGYNISESGEAGQFFVVRDSFEEGYVYKSIRSADAAASHI